MSGKNKAEAEVDDLRAKNARLTSALEVAKKESEVMRGRCIKPGEESQVQALLVRAEAAESRGQNLYAELNAYMNPTATRMSSREGLRKALDRFRKDAAQIPDGGRL